MKTKIVQVTAIGMSQVKLLSKLNNTLVEKGFEVHAVCTADKYTDQLAKDNIIFHDVKIDRAINPKGNIKSIIEMIKIFKKVKPEIVHVHTPVAAVLGRIAAKIAGVPHVIYTAHGFYFHEGMSSMKYKLFFTIEKYIGRIFTDYIFTQSKEDYDLAVKNDFLKNDNYLHISNGIDLNNQFNLSNISNTEIIELKEHLNIQENDIVFTFLGRMVKEKGIIELLEAFKILSSENKNVKLLCMGSMPDSERDDSIAGLLKNYDSNQITFLGQVSSPENYYALSDVFVLPSYREGMPRSIIEAMAMKNAIIATDIRGSREEVSHKENGYLVEVQNIPQLLEAMRYLTNHPDKIESMKEAGYKKTLAEYDEQQVVGKQLKVFNEILERR